MAVSPIWAKGHQGKAAPRATSDTYATTTIHRTQAVPRPVRVRRKELGRGKATAQRAPAPAMAIGSPSLPTATTGIASLDADDTGEEGRADAEGEQQATPTPKPKLSPTPSVVAQQPVHRPPCQHSIITTNLERSWVMQKLNDDDAIALALTLVLLPAGIHHLRRGYRHPPRAHPRRRQGEPHRLGAHPPRHDTHPTLHRLATSSSMDDDPTAPVHWATTQYIAEYLIGNPAQQAEAITSSTPAGSNLVWTQCTACQQPNSNCFSQDLPFYDPSQSATSQAVSCTDTACGLGSETQCSSDDVPSRRWLRRRHHLRIGDDGHPCLRSGASRRRASLKAPSTVRPAYIIGLGRGGLSIVSQLSDSNHLFPQQGNNAPVTSVPFVPNPTDYPYDAFYCLPLTGITVGATMLDVPEDVFELREVGPGQWAGTLIDSGSPFTSLVDVAYQALEDELTRQLGDSLVQPPAQGSDLCVARTDMHGQGGAIAGGDLVVPPENYWGPVDDDTACMLVLESSDSTTTIGNFMQQNKHLLYDLANAVLSFQTADCSSIVPTSAAFPGRRIGRMEG
ncbi:hypothetical protein HU200_020287 [Digitaria exilis]|uniref:Peptidase A1 domain-containing protein n=1 Tax=Digitaria exilis TaxID=1010633 RepID=A0A835KH34_9POAL|nr:hypothetical protein HU200_020287 [Digitaria exilis]